MITSLVRQRSGTKVMPVSANMRPAPRFTRMPNSLAGLGAAYLQRPGPTGGTEIVDNNGNVVYTEADVAANPSLLSQIGQSVCANGALPTWYPGGESVCADSISLNPGDVSSEGVALRQGSYLIPGQSVSNAAGGWVNTGGDPTNPANWVWNLPGNPTYMNPAYTWNPAALPTAYMPTNLDTSGGSTAPETQAQFESAAQAGVTQQQLQVASSTPATVPAPATNPVANALKPPATGSAATGVTQQALANASQQSGNANVSVGPNSPTIADQFSQLEAEAASATGLSGTTLLLIAAGVVALMVLKK